MYVCIGIFGYIWSPLKDRLFQKRKQKQKAGRDLGLFYFLFLKKFRADWMYLEKML